MRATLITVFLVLFKTSTALSPNLQSDLHESSEIDDSISSTSSGRIDRGDSSPQTECRLL